MTPEIGRWYRVISGPHKGKAGCCDLVKAEGAGIRYRLSNRSEIVGRFAADQLAPSQAPSYESKVPAEVQQQALDLLMGRNR